MLVPGQVSQQVFTPDSFNPGIVLQQQQPQSVNDLYMNQQHAAPSQFARQNSGFSSGFMQQPYAAEANVSQS